jgi:alpha-1,2-mannosyltransferase
MARAEPGLAAAAGAPPAGGPGPAGDRRRWRALAWAAAAFAVALAAYVADVATHPIKLTLGWFDLNIYNHAGLLVRHAPDTLYTWHFLPGVQYLYTPFAALGFAAGSLLPWAVLTWLTTVASLAAMVFTVWLTFGQLGWRGRDRAAAVLALSSVALWLEPVLRAVQVGQIELLLMALIVWDLGQNDDRRWKGAGVGLAAGIKLVPLIFIPYLLLAGKRRQAAVATAVFAGTVLAGFAALPHASAQWWLTGYFVHPGNVGDVGSLLNQSLFALVTRAAGGVRAATGPWLVLSAAVAVTGLAAAAALHRSGRPVYGWLTCALTGLLVSPISWDHHWVWVVPVLVVLADAAVRARGAARWGYGALAAVVAALFADWPGHWTGPGALVPQGLLGFFIGRHPQLEKYHLYGLQVIGWNLYVLSGLALFALAVAAAARATLGRRARA